MNYKEVIKCPKCNSEMIDFDKKGYSAGKALAGVILTGGIGLLAGFIGKNKVRATCLSCGNKFDPKDGYYKVYIREEIAPIEQKNIKSVAPQKIHTQEDIDKKIAVYQSFLERGIITKDEMDKKIAQLTT